MPHSFRVLQRGGWGEDPWGICHIAVSASTEINRKDFGSTWNAALGTGGILVGEEVTVTLETQFVEAKSEYSEEQCVLQRIEAAVAVNTQVCHNAEANQPPISAAFLSGLYETITSLDSAKAVLSD